MSDHDQPASAPGAPGGRSRGAGHSRELLLRAALELFAERGFDHTTTREIGERAGVDAALIARYFGGKTQLYLAALEAESGEGAPAGLLDEDRLRALLGRSTRRGPGPVVRAALVAHTDPALQDAAHAQLYERLVDPTRHRFAEEGVPDPELRAELAVAALAGILLARHTGALGTLATAEPEKLFGLVGELLAAVHPAPAPPDGPRSTE